MFKASKLCEITTYLNIRCLFFFAAFVIKLVDGSEKVLLGVTTWHRKGENDWKEHPSWDAYICTVDQEVTCCLWFSQFHYVQVIFSIFLFKL